MNYEHRPKYFSLSIALYLISTSWVKGANKPTKRAICFLSTKVCLRSSPYIPFPFRIHTNYILNPSPIQDHFHFHPKAQKYFRSLLVSSLKLWKSKFNSTKNNLWWYWSLDANFFSSFIWDAQIHNSWERAPSRNPPKTRRKQIFNMFWVWNYVETKTIQ